MSKMDPIEMMARMWIECDPNRGGCDPDDPIEPNERSDGVTLLSPLVGKPYWHWFKPRAEATLEFIQRHGYTLVAEKKRGA